MGYIFIFILGYTERAIRNVHISTMRIFTPNVLVFSESGWSTAGILRRLCRRWAHRGIRSCCFCWKKQHQPLRRCTPEDRQNLPVRRKDFDWLILRVLKKKAADIERTDTYLTEPFVCFISTCTDNTGRKWGMPLFLTHLWVNYRHVHHSELVRLSSSFSLSPSSHLAHFILF